MIFTYPSPVLRKKSSKIITVDDKLLKTITSLRKELKRSEIAVGLAAPQVGVNISVFALKDIVTCDCHKKNCDNICFFINPEIVDSFNTDLVYPKMINDKGKKEDFLEGCLSFPDLYGTVKRWLKIKVRYQVLNDQNKLVEKEEVLDNLASIVFQHELDHLTGTLFIDRIKQDNGKFFKEEKNRLVKKSIDSFV